MGSRVLGLGVVVALSGFLTACGGDSDDNKGSGGTSGSGGTGAVGGTAGTGGSTAGTGGTGGSTAGTGGTGATGGSGATGGTGATGGSGGNGNLACGTASCPSYNIANFIDLPPCCPDGLENICGVDATALGGFVDGLSGCFRIDAPGTADSSCPPLDVGIGGVTFPGCCTEANVCGNDLNAGPLGGPDLGCVSTAEYLDAGAPQPCGSGTGGTGGAGGTGGTGGTGGSTGGTGGSTGGTGGAAP
ncbi:MAG: hypothetical protein KIT72_06825 [Polyangiaceae bacterium]|nr:hypothetical protein [Polyangiaceae bacterium]MCW5790117.1 hypothetical protein [Polyangiaceae bacterium]